jgi:hypothetical protein
MYYPYLSKKDKKLYHFWCLPEDEIDNAVETETKKSEGNQTNANN